MLRAVIDDEQAIREVVDTWMAASKAGDLETVLGLMTDDVLFLTPGRQPFDKEEFRVQSEGMKGVELDGRAETLEIEVLGDRAWIRNHLEIAVTRPDSQPVRRSGHTLTILKKSADGRWRLFRDANLVS